MAKKFAFRLEPVLRFRRQIEDDMRTRYRQIQTIRERKLGEIDELQRQTGEALEAMIDAKTGLIDAARVKLLNRYLTGLGVSMRQRSGELRAVDGEAERRRVELVHARRDVKAMEKLRTRRYNDYLYEAGREETRMLDEMGGEMVRRRAAAQAAREKSVSG